MSDGSSRKVLVVDDAFLIRRMFRTTLSQLGFEVEESSNGQDAFDLISENGIDYYSLLIVDLMMPIMNGLELVEKLCGEYKGKMPPTLICSCRSEVPEIKKLVSLGIEGYIVKPIDYEVLKNKIGELFPDILE
jgi:DNA-binding response OmpR family regulator